MRPERIIVGEVRGPEAFDLLQAMNTGHDGSMGTLHANSPREAISRLESMIMMGGFQLPVRTIREMITGSIDVIIQAARLRDGSRKVTHITEVIGMEGDVVTLQNLIVYEITGEDANGKHPRPPPLHRHRPPALLGSRGVLTTRKAGSPRRWRPPRFSTTTAIRSETSMPERDLMPFGAAAARRARRRRRSPMRSSIPISPATARRTSACRASSEPQGARRLRPCCGRRAVAPQDGRRHAEGHGEPAEGEGEGHAAAAPQARRSRHQPQDFWLASAACGVVLAVARHVLLPSSAHAHVPRRCSWGFVGVFGVPRWFVEQADRAAAERNSSPSSPTPSTSSCAA